MAETATTDVAAIDGRPALPLRIGFVVSGTDGLENWQLQVLDRIAGDDRFAAVALLVHPTPYGDQQEPRLFRAWAKMEKALLAREPAYRPEVFTLAGQRVERLTAASGQEHGVDVAKTLILLEELDLHLVVGMTRLGLPDAAVERLPFGEWTFSFSADRSLSADWSGYSSLLAGEASVPLSLDIRHGRNDLSQRIAGARFNIKFSGERNGGFIKERAVTLLMRELGRLADLGRIETVEAERPVPSPPPTAPHMAWYGFNLARQLTGRAIKAFRARAGIGTTIWTLYWGRGNIADFDPSQSVEWPSTPEEIRADPFLLDHGGQSYVFYEAYSSKVKKAHIAVSRIEAHGLVPLGIALIRDYHLSYPFVFHHGGELYMMPETNQARRVEIWRCVDFPLKWELHSTALEGQSPADSVLQEIDGRWWLITNLSDFHAYEDHCSELHVFEVDGPDLKRVTPHRRNPVVIDGLTARNGGRLFEVDGKLYRSAQRNEYGVYGHGLNVMQVDRLDLDDYREHCVRIVRPDFKPALLGCHHFDCAGDRYVIDARLGQ